MVNRKVRNNINWIIVCRLGQSIVGMVIGMFTARYLGPSNYGVINYAASLVAFVLPVMQLGLSSLMVQEILRNPEEEGRTIGTILLTCTASAVLCMGGIAAFVMLTSPGDQETIIVCVLYSTVLVFQALEMLRYWFQAKLMAKYSSIVALIAYVLSAVYKLWLLISGKNIYWFALTSVLDSAIIAFAQLFLYRRLLGRPLRFSFAAAKRMINRSRYFIVSSLMITVFAQTDKIMLKLMIDEASTGIYAAAVTCASMFGFVYAAVVDSFRPLILESKNKDEAQYEKYVMQLYVMVIGMSLLQCIGTTIFAKLIIKVLYGAAYAEAAHVLRLVVWFTTFSYIGGVRSVWILAENLQKHLWFINLTGAVTNIVLNLLLIPKIGMYGAACASVLTQFFTNFLLGYIYKPLRKNNCLMLRALSIKNILNLIPERE